MCAFVLRFIVATYLVLFPTTSPIALASPAIDWIISTQNADGSYILTTDIATATQSTAEALSTFTTSEEYTDAGIPLAVDYVNAETYLNTENLSRLIIANHQAGADVSLLLSELERYQNFDGGFGEMPGYDSTSLDTAFALIAMAAAGYDDIDAVDVAIAYLVNHQRVDGSFILSDTNESSNYITALCSMALQQYRFVFDVSAELQAANEYLLAQQSPGAGWGTAWETAVALLSIVAITTDSTRYNDAAQVLRSQQLANGSWANDVFVTALAARALHLADNVKQPVALKDGVVSGRLVRDGTLLPLSSVQVRVDELPSVRVASDDAGRYTLSGLPASTYTIRYQADGYRAASQTLSIQAGQVVDVGTMRLMPTTDTGIVSGLVTDKLSGLPVSDANITVTGAFIASTNTDMAGTYSVAGAAGSVRINVLAPGYGPAVASAEVTGGGTIKFSPALHPSGETNTDLASIRGSVIDAETGQAVIQAGVKVLVSGQAVNTDANGGFTIQNLAAGALTVSITHNDYQARQYRMALSEGSAIDLGMILLTRSVAQTTTTTIHGTVTDADTGVAIAGARVAVVGGGISSVTDSNGRYRFDNLSGNRFNLVTRAVGYFEATGTVSVTEPAVVDLNFSMNRASASDLDIVDMHIETGITSYPALAEIEADAILYNSGSANHSVRMYYKVVDAHNVIVAEGPVTAVPLGVDPSSALLTVPAGQAIETEIEWYSGSSPAGDYQIIAQAYDGRTGQLLAERAITITVESTNRIGGAAEFDPPIAQLAANTPVQIGAIVRNAGNQLIEATALTARVILNKQGYRSRKDLAQLDAILTDAAFDDTRGMAIDNNGNLYAVNNRNNSVSLIATDGSVTKFAGNLNNPVDIDIARGGDIYILNRNRSYVRIDTAGNRTEMHTGLSDQSAIEALNDDRVLITQADALYAVSPDGSLEKMISGGLAAPHDMVINSNGDVFIASTDDNSITRYSNGTLSRFVAGINKPYGLAVDVNDDLIVTSFGDNSLLRVTPDGTVSVIATDLSGPTDVLIDNDGHYIVSNAMSNEVVSIDATGAQQILADQTINKPSAAIFNSSGELFVSNTGFSNITKFSPDGTVMEFAANISEPVALLESGDGGVEVLQADGSILHISAAGTKTTITTGLAGSKDFVRDSGGDGYIVLESSRNRITHRHADGQYSLHTDPLLDTVRAMTLSAAGDVYVLAGPINNQMLLRITADKTTEVITRGMPFSRGITVDANDTVYVTDYNARKVLKIDASGSMTVLARTPFAPGAMTLTASGDVLLAPFGGKTVYTLNLDGSLTERITLPSKIMYGLIEDSNGNLWVSDQNTGTVLRISAANTIERFSVRSAGVLQADDRGGVYVSTYGGIKHIDSGGAVSNALNHDAIGQVYIVAFVRDRNGDYWIPDTNAITYLFDDASNLLQRFTSLKQPSGMITDANGHLVVTNGNNTVVRIRHHGALPEVLTTGNFRAIARETADIALVSSGGAARRLHLATGDLSPVIPYRATTLSTVAAIAVNPEGGFVLADNGHNRLHFYDASDTEVDVQVGIVNPRGLTLDQNGNILVANAEPKGIAAVRDDRRADMYLFDFNGFDYLLTKPDGNIYAASRRDGTIFEYDQGKRHINTLRVPESDALVIDANGLLLSTMPSEGALIRIATDGSNSYQRLASGLSHAADVETDSAGGTYITDSSRNTILKLNADGSLSLDVAKVEDASWLAFSPNGDKLVSYAANRLALFEAGGGRIELPLANIIEPDMQFGGLAMDDDGAIYLSTGAQDSMLKLQAQVTEPEIQTGQVVYSVSARLDGLSIDGQVTIDFGAWTPSRSGEYRVEITADNGVTDGSLMNTLHVGANADGLIVLNDAAVQSGDQAINAVLTISGADPTQFTKIETQNLTLAARTYALLGRGITSDSHGNVYASDLNKIVKVTPNGVVSDFVSGIDEGISMSGMVTDSMDTLYTPSSNGLLLKFTPDGQKSSIGTFPSKVEAVALDSHDQLYTVTSAGRLYQVDKASGAATELPAEGLHAPRGMTIDAYGNIYVLNKNTTGAGTDPIIRITPGGTSTNFFDYANFEFEGIPLAADCSSNLLFAPIKLPPFKYRGEEDIIVQLIGETGEVNKILHGPTIASGLGDIDVISFDRFGNRLLFYTDWNNGEIFAFPIICGGIAVEAHLVTRADVDLSSTDPAPSRILDGSDGTREYIWQLSEVDNQGLDIELNLLLRDLVEGEHRPIFSEAFLEFINSFNPDAPVKVAMDIPAVLASSRVSIVTRVDAGQYKADSLVDIAVEVSNDSAVTFDGSVSLNVIDAAGFTVETLPAIAIDALPARSSLNLSSVWNTGITLAGDYTVVATLKNIGGKTLASSEASYHIQAGSFTSPVITASISTDKIRYSTWDTVAISGRLRNASSNSIQGNVVAMLTVTDSSGAVVHTETVTLNELYPGSYRDVSSRFALVDASAGRYRVTLVSRNAATGAELVQTEYGFDVEHIISHDVTGGVQARFSQLDTNEANICTETITNLSATAINAATVRHLFVDVAAGTTMTSNEQVVDLAAGATLSFPQMVTLNSNQPGVYACVLQIDIAGDSRTLATAGFEFIEPENLFDIDISLGVGTGGRLLVLLDPADWRSHDHGNGNGNDNDNDDDNDDKNQRQHDSDRDDGNDEEDDHDDEYQRHRHRGHDSTNYHDRDPYGPAGAPLLSTQRDVLAYLLRQAGWSYTLVDSADAFTRAMRSGAYSAFALFSEQIKLNEQVQQELVTAVYRGEGLLVGGGHDLRNDKLRDALGIRNMGKHHHTTGIELTDAESLGAANLLFAVDHRSMRIETRGAEVLATYTGIDNIRTDDDDDEYDHRYRKPSKHSNAAITRFSYGSGVSVFSGFDLLAEMTSMQVDSAFTALLVDVLADIGRVSPNFASGGVVPIELFLANNGPVMLGRVSLSWPDNAGLLDIAPLPAIDANTASWPIDLAIDDNAIQKLWLQTPHTAGVVDLSARLQIGVGPSLDDFATRNLSLLITPVATLAEIKARLNSLKNQHALYGKAGRAIAGAIEEAQRSDFKDAIKRALKAIDKLNNIDSDDARSVQMDIARAIRVLAMQWTLGTNNDTDMRTEDWP
ncbi:MAG: carboxypeptidase-like regulatory domain-containing protein [Gammaproteobacteria bacterium]|nr:carboxypeptidase-like regulatory domain-containing protein [Gammaproteobacteria bacterium]